MKHIVNGSHSEPMFTMCPWLFLHERLVHLFQHLSWVRSWSRFRFNAFQCKYNNVVLTHQCLISSLSLVNHNGTWHMPYLFIFYFDLVTLSARFCSVCCYIDNKYIRRHRESVALWIFWVRAMASSAILTQFPELEIFSEWSQMQHYRLRSTVLHTANRCRAM